MSKNPFYHELKLGYTKNTEKLLEKKYFFKLPENNLVLDIYEFIEHMENACVFYTALANEFVTKSERFIEELISVDDKDLERVKGMVDSHTSDLRDYENLLMPIYNLKEALYTKVKSFFDTHFCHNKNSLIKDIQNSFDLWLEKIYFHQIRYLTGINGMCYYTRLPKKDYKYYCIETIQFNVDEYKEYDSRFKFYHTRFFTFFNEILDSCILQENFYPKIAKAKQRKQYKEMNEYSVFFKLLFELNYLKVFKENKKLINALICLYEVLGRESRNPGRYYDREYADFDQIHTEIFGESSIQYKCNYENCLLLKNLSKNKNYNETLENDIENEEYRDMIQIERSLELNSNDPRFHFSCIFIPKLITMAPDFIVSKFETLSEKFVNNLFIIFSRMDLHRKTTLQEIYQDFIDYNEKGFEKYIFETAINEDHSVTYKIFQQCYLFMCQCINELTIFLFTEPQKAEFLSKIGIQQKLDAIQNDSISEIYYLKNFIKNSSETLKMADLGDQFFEKSSTERKGKINNLEKNILEKKNLLHRGKTNQKKVCLEYEYLDCIVFITNNLRKICQKIKNDITSISEDIVSNKQKHLKLRIMEYLLQRKTHLNNTIIILFNKMLFLAIRQTLEHPQRINEFIEKLNAEVAAICIWILELLKTQNEGGFPQKYIESVDRFHEKKINGNTYDLSLGALLFLYKKILEKRLSQYRENPFN